jgi:hypothetical protein
VHVALLIQDATCMRHIVTSFVAYLVQPNFSTLSHKRHDFRKKKKKRVTEHKSVFLFPLQLLFQTFLILRIIQRDIIIPIVQKAGWAPGPVWTGVENLVPTGIRSPNRPARSVSLYRLSYPGPLTLRLVLPSGLLPSGFPTEALHTCYMPCPPQSS